MALENLEVTWPAIIDEVERMSDLDCARFRDATFHVQNYVRSVDNTPEQNAHIISLAGLEAKPWWALEDFSSKLKGHLQKLEHLAKELTQEFRDGRHKIGLGEKASTGYFGKNPGWRIFPFYTEESEEVLGASEIFPQIAAILRAMRKDNFIAKSHFSVLKPGAQIAVHCGAVNYELRLHYGLQVPKGDLGLRVGGETRQWQNGKTLIFDDSYPHEVWNNTPDDRFILHCRLLHPGLTDGDRKATYLLNDRMNQVLETDANTN